MHPNVQKWLDFEYAPQKSQEWLDLRMGMLTASDAASAIGVNKYETPHQLLLKSVAKVNHFLVTKQLDTGKSMKMRHAFCTNRDTGKLYTN
jgi:hypothetical protein